MRKKMGHSPLFLILICSGILICTSTIVAQDIWGHFRQNQPVLDDNHPLYVGGAPPQYSTIKEAADAAKEGDTIFVCDDIYYDSIQFNKAINLIGGNPVATVIDGDPVFIIGNLTIQPGLNLLVGDSPTLHMTVTNTGDAGEDTIFLYMNGEIHQECNVTVWVNATETKNVVLVVPPLMVPGVFEVNVGNLTAVAPGVTPISITVYNPPIFIYSNLTVSPTEILAGESVDLEVNVKNMGVGGPVTTFLYLNSTRQGYSVTVFLLPQETKRVVLAGVTLVTPGVFEVSVGNLTTVAPELTPVTVTVLRENDPPVISPIDILCFSQTPGNWINISVTVTDNVKVDEVYLNMTLPNNTIKTYSLTHTITGTIRYYLNESYSYPGLYTFFILARDSSGNENTSVTTNFWIYEGISQKAVAIGQNIIDVTSEMNLLLVCNATSNTTITFSRYPNNPHQDVSQQVGLLPVFLDIEIDNSSAIQWPIALTIYFTGSDLENTSMNTSQLLGMFYWNEIETLWTLIDDTGINTTGSNGYMGSVWGHISHMYTVAAGGDNYPPVTEILDGPSGTIGYTNVTFEWTGTDSFTPASALNYYYKLEGYDASWSPQVSSTSKMYTNLPNGSYTFKVKAEDGVGNIDTTPAERAFTVKMVVIKPPVCSLSASPTSGLAPLTVTFTLTASDPDGTIATWTLDINNDGTPEHTGSGNPPSTVQHIYNNSGVYIAKLTVTDNDEATANDTVTVTVSVPGNQSPQANFTWLPGSPSDLDSVTFIDHSLDPDGVILNWTWNLGDGTIIYGENISHRYHVDGTYLISLTVRDNNDAANTTKRTIHISNIYPTADFTYSSDERLVTFTDTSTDSDGAITSWYWDFGDQNYSVSSSPIHEYREGGDYTVKLTVTDDDGETDSVTQVITVEKDEGIPGFELLTLFGALAIVFLWRRKA